MQLTPPAHPTRKLPKPGKCHPAKVLHTAYLQLTYSLQTAYKQLTNSLQPRHKKGNFSGPEMSFWVCPKEGRLLSRRCVGCDEKDAFSRDAAWAVNGKRPSETDKDAACRLSLTTMPVRSLPRRDLPLTNRNTRAQDKQAMGPLSPHSLQTSHMLPSSQLKEGKLWAPKSGFLPSPPNPQILACLCTPEQRIFIVSFS